MSRWMKMVLSLAMLAGVGAGTFFGVRALRDQSGTEAQAPGPVGPPSEVFGAERSQPRFVGEVLGIFIGPPGAAMPERYLTFEEVCGPWALSVEVPEEKAGQLGLSVELPPPFMLDKDSLNTGVIACKDDPERVYAARWEYDAPQPSGHRGRLLIVRSLFAYWEYDVAASRVKSTEIGGRPAVLVEPITPDGVNSVAAVIFPEPFGKTVVQSTSVPVADLLAVAEIVARATWPQ